MTDKTIFIFDAQEGDKLADDVHTPDGNILAKKDTCSNDCIPACTYFSILHMHGKE